MTLTDRILAACSGDEESADLVLELLARPQLERVRLLREEGRPVTGPTPAGATPPTLLTEQPCPTCLVDFDDSCCPICGRLQKQETAAARPSVVPPYNPPVGGEQKCPNP